MARHLLVGDNETPDYLKWLETLSLTDTDLLLLEPNRDGLGQVLHHLQSTTLPYDALLVVSHGSPGSVQLGSTT